MSAMITRLPIQLERNPKRVITRLFLPGDQKRIRDIIERVCAFSAGEVKTMLAQLQRSFQTLHPDIEDVFLKHFEAATHIAASVGFHYQPTTAAKTII